ncbi:MAG: AAA family ATPase [Chloroflexota bacterium]
MKRVIYSAGSLAELRRKNGYFVDKTKYIAKVERVSNPIFLRPRRFGKSFFCSILKSYYDLAQKDVFEELFGDTWIGQHPTGDQNQFMVLSLSFSGIESGPSFGMSNDPIPKARAILSLLASTTRSFLVSAG